jgi:hypothetical protein
MKRRREDWDLVGLGERRKQEVESERRVYHTLSAVGWSERWCVQGAAEEKGASVVSSLLGRIRINILNKYIVASFDAESVGVENESAWR